MVAVVSLYTAISNRRIAEEKQRDAASVTYLNIIAPLETQLQRQAKRIDVQTKEIEAMENRLVAVENENLALRQGIQILTNQLSRLGHEPAWTP